MSEQEYDHEESSVAGGGSRRQSNPLVALFVFVMLIIGLVVSLAHFASQGKSFHAAPYALQIAQKAYNTRKNRAPTGHDFGGGIIVVHYADRSAPSVYESPIYEGYDSPPPDVNATHSERRTQDGFILPTLTLLRQRGIVAKASEIDVVIFTQFYPCPSCRSEMRAWQNQDRQAAGSANVAMTVWTLATSFSPLTSNPQKRAQPAVQDESDLQVVPITFDPPSPTASKGCSGLTVERKFRYNDFAGNSSRERRQA